MFAAQPTSDRCLLNEASPLVQDYTRTSDRSISIVGISHGIMSPTEEDVLTGAIFERCIGDAPILDRHNCSRKIALLISTTTSLSAGAGFVPISLPLPAGPLFAAANFIGFFKLDIWAIRGTIDDLLGARSQKEIVLLDRASTGKCIKVAVVTASTVIALLSQVPVALPALDYDGKWGVPAVIGLFIGGMLLPIRSLQLSISKTIRVWHNNTKEVTREIERLRMIMASMVDHHRDLFRKMDRADQLAQLDRLNHLEGTDLEKTGRFIEMVLEEPLEIQELPSPSLSSRVAMVVGLWIAGSLQTGLAIYTFEKTKAHIIDDDIAAGVLAGSVVLSGIYLSGKSIIDTTERITGAFLRFVRGRREKAIVEQLRPKLTLSLKLLGLVIDLGALGATIVIWGDFYKNNLPAKIYFETTLCLAYFLFLSTSTLDMVDEVVEEIIQCRGDDEERSIVLLNCKLKKMQKLIESTALLDLSVFVSQCPDRLRTRLLAKIGFTTERLEKLA